MKKMILSFFAIALSVQISHAAAVQIQDHNASAEEIQKALENNARYHEKGRSSRAPVPWRPVEDTANMSYVLMSAYEQTDEVQNLRKTIAQNLPAGVKLVILADSGDEQDIKQEYSSWISSDRLLVVTDSDTENGFWARDAFPYPVYNSQKKDIALIGHRYYRDFNSGKAIAHGVEASDYRPEDFTFVGGNLLSDEEGNCFSINSYRLFTVTPEDLKAAYGCKTVHIMEHVSGIGDADEVLKPLSGHRILTNASQYKSQLEAWGYQVILLPSIPNSYRTYANSLVIKNTVFMPSYGLSTDQQAAAVYEKLGYKVVMIRSNGLSDNMHGSIHCQVMAYPAINEKILIQALKRR